MVAARGLNPQGRALPPPRRDVSVWKCGIATVAIRACEAHGFVGRHTARGGGRCFEVGRAVSDSPRVPFADGPKGGTGPRKP
jgi:hypothetical protein